MPLKSPKNAFSGGRGVEKYSDLRRVLSGQKRRWGKVWETPARGVEVNFSEYSVVVSPPQCIVLSIPLRMEG